MKSSGNKNNWTCAKVTGESVSPGEEGTADPRGLDSTSLGPISCTPWRRSIWWTITQFRWATPQRSQRNTSNYAANPLFLRTCFLKAVCERRTRRWRRIKIPCLRCLFGAVKSSWCTCIRQALHPWRWWEHHVWPISIITMPAHSERRRKLIRSSSSSSSGNHKTQLPGSWCSPCGCAVNLLETSALNQCPLTVHHCWIPHGATPHFICSRTPRTANPRQCDRSFPRSVHPVPKCAPSPSDELLGAC